MFSTPAFRETFVLILFGIILVPIAAKRAHDAPGYWQTFPKELSSLASYSNTDETALWTSSLAMSLNDTIAYPRLRKSAKQPLPRHARPRQDASTSVVQYAASSAPEAERAPLTIRFQIATFEQEAGVEMVTIKSPGDSAMATPAPVPAPRTTALAEPMTAEPPTIAKESEASKGRWTLIWMCSAITAVAVFMSSC